MRSRTKALRNAIVRHHIGIIGPDALGQQHVVEAELLPAHDLGRGDGVERPVGEQREIGRHLEKLPVVGVDPDAELALLAARHHVGARPGDGHDQIVTGAASRAWRRPFRPSRTAPVPRRNSSASR